MHLLFAALMVSRECWDVQIIIIPSMYLLSPGPGLSLMFSESLSLSTAQFLFRRIWSDLTSTWSVSPRRDWISRLCFNHGPIRGRSRTLGCLWTPVSKVTLFILLLSNRTHLFSSDEGRAQSAVLTAAAVTRGAGNNSFWLVNTDHVTLILVSYWSVSVWWPRPSTGCWCWAAPGWARPRSSPSSCMTSSAPSTRWAQVSTRWAQVGTSEYK